MDTHGPSECGTDGTVSAAFERAAKLSGAARNAWLAQLAVRQPRLAEILRAWLAGDAADDLLDAAPAQLADDLTRHHASLKPGTRLGAWRVLDTLGDGGMGRVYLAERADGAFAKQVAIKVLRRERQLPAELLRRERHLLARLEHPAITRILDGGVSTDGDVYLVMERVHGEHLDTWCRRHAPSLDARLTLFSQVADAVAYAHRELVIHGDIKPNNVIVDTDGRARLLDFGIARLLAEAADATPTPTLALTPAWSAPEVQNGAAPDVRADVYALGALLHFLLHAKPPTTACDGHGDRDHHAPAIRSPATPRDLAAIVTRALAARADDRYTDVTALRDDIARFRDHRPVAARESGRAYACRCFVRRHRLATVGAAAFLCMLITATAVVGWQNTVVRAERDRATQAAARSQTVLDYLIGVIGAADQTATQKQPASLRRLLDDSLARINTDFAGDLAARQLLLARLAELHVRLSDFATADTLLTWFQRGETGQSPALVRARVLDNLALIRMHQGKIDAATDYSRQALAALAERPLANRGLHSQILVTRAQIEHRRGHADAALETLRNALRLRLEVSPAHAGQTVVVRNSLAIALMRKGRMREALEQFRLLEQALASSRREHSKDAANIYNNYASTSFAWGLYAQAERLFAKAMTLQRDVYGPSAGLAALLNNYGKLKLRRGEIDAGAELIERANDMMTRFAGTDSVDAQLIRLGTGDVAQARGDFARAKIVYASVVAALEDTLGRQHPLMARLHALELAARARATHLAVDDPAFDKILNALAQSAHGDRPRADLLCLRAELALAQHALAYALQSATACTQLRERSQAPASPTLAVAHYLRAEATLQSEPATAAREQRDTRWQQLTDILGPQHPRLKHLAALRKT